MGQKDLQAKKETVNGSVFIRESLRMIPSVLLAALLLAPSVLFAASSTSTKIGNFSHRWSLNRMSQAL